MLVLDCGMVCSSGTLNADCTFCECAMNMTMQAFASEGQPLLNVSITHSAAPLDELFVTSSNGWFTVLGVCQRDSFLAKRSGFIDLEFEADPAVSTITLQRVGKSTTVV